MSDNLTKARIQMKLNQIQNAGLSAPELSGTLQEQEATLKKFIADNRVPASPKTPKGSKVTIVKAEAPEKKEPPVSEEQFKKEVEKAVAQQMKEQNERMAQMEQMLAKLVNSGDVKPSDPSDVLEKAIARLEKATTGQKNEYGLLREEFIPAGDRLEKPETYFIGSDNWNIWGRVDGNFMTSPPLGKKFIKFTRAWGRTVRTPQGIRQKRIATYICHSKTISSWLKSLPTFNRVFFLSMDQALATSANMTFAQVFQKHYGSLQGKPHKTLIEKASQMGLPVNPDITSEEYAAQIAEQLAMNELRQEESRIKDAQRVIETRSLLAAQPV